MDEQTIKKLKNLLKQELSNLATKDDLSKGLESLEKKLIQKIDDTEIAIIARVDQFKADKETVSELEGRVERLERKLID